MKGFQNIFLVITLFIVAISCSSNSTSKIGLLVHTTQSTRWQMDIQYIREKAEELGIEVLLRDAEKDENKQLEQGEELINAGVDVLIVIAANQNTAAGIVRNAHRNKVPVISYDRLIRNSEVDYLVSFHYEKVGALLVEYVANRVPQGNCILLYGDSNDGNALFVKNGITQKLSMLGANEKLNVIYETFVDDWSYDNAKHKVNKILDFHPAKVDAVIACNDPLGIGAYDALKDHGYNENEVVITGQDATEEFVSSMKNGGVTMSIYKPIEELAHSAVELAYHVINKEEVTGLNSTVNNGRCDVPAMLFEPSVVDATNYKAVLN
ncbi:MAG: substrate-binding domain-containing protein [Prolixibacteraceae bacterium]|jgi:D-xylose transport system substrate-binding protein|nr:substrate-binding domain-containing protein [Prolixibacteraceae bacterium]